MYKPKKPNIKKNIEHIKKQPIDKIGFLVLRIPFKF